jgi:hypothetical protein
MDIPDIRALAEEMKGAIATLQSQMETSSPDVAHVRDLARKLGPAAAFDATVLAKELATIYQITIEEGHELVEEYDWWKSVKGALGFIRQKHSVVTAEVTRRRSQDAEQAVFDVKGKIKRVEQLLDQDVTIIAAVRSNREDIKRAMSLLHEINDRLATVGP